jgi:hypothetical protein
MFAHAGVPVTVVDSVPEAGAFAGVGDGLRGVTAPAEEVPVARTGAPTAAAREWDETEAAAPLARSTASTATIRKEAQMARFPSVVPTVMEFDGRLGLTWGLASEDGPGRPAGVVRTSLGIRT